MDPAPPESLALSSSAEQLDARLERELLAPLRMLRRRIRLYMLLDGLLWFATAVVLAALAQMALDWNFRFSVGQRGVISGLVVLYWLWAGYRRLYEPLARPLPEDLLAGIADRAHPDLCGRISAAVELRAVARGAPDSAGHLPVGASPDLARLVLAEACQSVRGRRLQGMLNHRRALLHAVELVLLVLLAGLACAAAPWLAGPWLERNWLLRDVRWPQRTYILPEGFDADGRRRMARGDPAEITAAVAGLVPDNAVVTWWTPSGRQGREPMSVVGDTRLAAGLGQLSEEIHFRISGGDEHTRDYLVEAVDRPRVVHTLARITPPEYTRLADVVVEQQTVLEVLRGATLTIEARLNKPIRRARFVADDGTDVQAKIDWPEDAAEPVVRVRWSAPDSGVFRFDLLDADGLTNRDPVPYRIRVVPDRPPNVEMELVGAGELTTPQAELPVQLQCEDAYGLGAARLMVQTGSQPERAFPLPGLTPGDRRFSANFALLVAASGAIAGDELRVWGEAEDLDPRGPNVGATPVATLRVVSPDDFLIELARRELTLRQEFERLVSAQRQIKEGLEQTSGLLADGAPPDAGLAQRLAALARRQAAHGSQCLGIARGFEQILRETETARVDRPADAARIAQRVVAPLEELARAAIPAAADAIDELRAKVSPAGRALAADHQADLLRHMEALLAEMVEWEGYREAVSLLEAVIAAQTALRADTLAALGEQLESILELERLLEPEDDAAPAP
jgi:hypothetical protein